MMAKDLLPPENIVTISDGTMEPPVDAEVEIRTAFGPAGTLESKLPISS